MSVEEIIFALRTKTIRFEVALTMKRPYPELQKLYNEVKQLQQLLDAAKRYEKIRLIADR